MGDKCDTHDMFFTISGFHHYLYGQYILSYLTGDASFHGCLLTEREVTSRHDGQQ